MPLDACSFERPGPIRTALCVRLLVAVGLITGLFPGNTARGGTNGRLRTKKVVQPKRTAHVKRAESTPKAFPAPRVASAAPVTPPASTSSVTPTIEQEIFALTNQSRQAIGLPALLINDQLTQAAQIQASAMATFDDMSHELPGAPHPTFESRLQYVGYPYTWAGENIAFGAPDAPSVVSLWMNSPPHRENILSPFPRETGVGVAYDGQGVPYYCQVFGEQQ